MTVDSLVVSLTLPYAFDTTDVLTLIVRGAAALLFLVVVPGVIYSVFVSGSMGAAALLVIVAGLTLYFARVIGMNVGGAKGTITPGAGATLARDLAAAVTLPFEERSSPY